MREVLELASRGRGVASPNPMVGALLVREGEVVGRGFHTWNGVKHAETLAMDEAGERARGATLYVNLEPCSHQGRTGPCADALIAAGISQVVAAMEDPNPLVAGAGFRKLTEAGIEVLLASEYTREAEKLNEAYCHFMRKAKPLVMLKAAVTLDGKIAAPEDNRGWITSETARASVQQLRHASDAILTGIGTVLTDDSLLNDRSGLARSRPLMRTSAASSERRRVLEQHGVRILTFDGKHGRTDLRRVVEHLAGEKYMSLMIEAGSKVNWAALELGVVDKIYFYYAPKILGGLQSLPVVGGTGRLRRVDAIQFHNVTVHNVAPDEFAVEAYLVKSA
jgi:diaminohydroxyphosphoribosylaminopyrimidine deaminase/5-amino-6-(5-phosphoribosylamino)uracil reductase